MLWAFLLENEGLQKTPSRKTQTVSSSCPWNLLSSSFPLYAAATLLGSARQKRGTRSDYEIPLPAEAMLGILPCTGSGTRPDPHGEFLQLRYASRL